MKVKTSLITIVYSTNLTHVNLYDLYDQLIHHPFLILICQFLKIYLSIYLSIYYWIHSSSTSIINQSYSIRRIKCKLCDQFREVITQLIAGQTKSLRYTWNFANGTQRQVTCKAVKTHYNSAMHQKILKHHCTDPAHPAKRSTVLSPLETSATSRPGSSASDLASPTPGSFFNRKRQKTMEDAVSSESSLWVFSLLNFPLK